MEQGVEIGGNGQSVLEESAVHILLDECTM